MTSCNVFAVCKNASCLNLHGWCREGGRELEEGGEGREEEEGWGLKQANSAYLPGEWGRTLGVGWQDWQRSSTEAETGKHSRINISPRMV